MGVRGCEPFRVLEEAYFHSAQASTLFLLRCRCTNPCCASGLLSTACPWYPFWPKSFNVPSIGVGCIQVKFIACQRDIKAPQCSLIWI